MLHRSFARAPHQLAYRPIRIEVGLIPAEELTRLTLLGDPKASEQTEAHYRLSRGLPAAMRSCQPARKRV